MRKRALSMRYALIACFTLLLCGGVFYQLTSKHTTQQAHASATSHWLYVVEDGTVFVYDIDNNHALVKQFTIPETGKRGVAVSPSRGMLYVSYCGANVCGGSHGSLLAYDLVNNKVAWNVSYAFGVDQPAITPDGSKIYMTHGSDSSDGITSVIDASNGTVTDSINTGTDTHNAVASLDGTQVYLTGYAGKNYNYVHVVNPANNQRFDVGPTLNGVRPFTVNAAHSLIFTTSSNTCGFQVLSLVTKAPLFTVPFSGSCAWSASTAPSHGISLSPDEKRVYVMDAPLDQLEVYDVSGLPSSAPTFVASVPLGSLAGFSSSCQTYCEREGWVLNDLSGRYVYVGDAGNVISTSTLNVVATLPALQNTRQMIEIDWTNGAISATSTRFGLGHGTTSNPPPNSPPAPVNKMWYFAEGRIDRGFREYLSLENPSATACAANIQYSYTPDGGTPATKSVAVSIKPYSRLTESVNQDLSNLDSSKTGINLAAIVAVDAMATPNCVGIVAERPMYFINFLGISSGTDVLGSTQLHTNYYFADVQSSAHATSYLTILNPNNISANVTVNYYLNGNVAGTQTIAVPANARGTIAPSAITLPAHVAAVVTSTQPIMVERPTYFTGVSVNGASVSGAFDVVGASNVAPDWLFAEGFTGQYTGNSTQEFLTIANLDPTQTAATVKITLKSRSGVTQTYTITVAAQSQTIWNVNANNTFAGSSPEVSAEVISTGANIVVQREMYFTYKHTLPNVSVGGTDVLGQVGPATHTVYSFSEGYANTGYNDWLTIQNPTGNAETLSITLVNGLGQSYVQSVPVQANARFTEDIASLVQKTFKAGTNQYANSFSMTVQTTNGGAFVAERPIYFNTHGVAQFAVQGGDDIIGYVGG